MIQHDLWLAHDHRRALEREARGWSPDHQQWSPEAQIIFEQLRLERYRQQSDPRQRPLRARLARAGARCGRGVVQALKTFEAMIQQTLQALLRERRGNR
jgi:hypothetical protein